MEGLHRAADACDDGYTHDGYSRVAHSKICPSSFVSQAPGRRSKKNPPDRGGVISDRHDAESAAVRPGSMRLRPSARYHDVSRLPIDRRRGRSNWLAASLAGRTRR